MNSSPLSFLVSWQTWKWTWTNKLSIWFLKHQRFVFLESSKKARIKPIPIDFPYLLNILYVNYICLYLYQTDRWLSCAKFSEVKPSKLIKLMMSPTSRLNTLSIENWPWCIKLIERLDNLFIVFELVCVLVDYFGIKSAKVSFRLRLLIFT